MSISYEKLIEKIEQELNKAKQANTQQQMKTHINTVKTLSELILEGESLQTAGITPHIVPAQTIQQPMMGIQSIQAEKQVKMEDGANGDSLFDF